MPTCELYRHGGLEAVDDLEAAVAAADAAEGFVWIRLDRPDRADFADIARVLDLHPLAVDDAVSARDRPKLDLYEQSRFLSLITLRRHDPMSPLDVGRVMVFLGDDFIVTVSQEDGDTLARARAHALHRANRLTPLAVLHSVLDVVVDDLAHVSDDVEDSILAAADRLFGLQRSDEAPLLYHLRRQLLAMSHAVQPLIEPLRHMSGGNSGEIDVETARRFQDVLDHALVVDREISEYRELVEHLRNSNDSRIALQQNTDMRRIAAWAAIVALPAAVTGFYGMNVPYPGFGETSGVVGAVTIQVLFAASLLVLFHRRHWL